MILYRSYNFVFFKSFYGTIENRLYLFHYIYVTNFYLHRQRYYKSQINSEY